ncbi:tail fiber assembly protein [Providencia rettgeri]|uniref:tail fiber assembly protein n=1 Tax=Providencia rettgeri TaxID=587 RepID=UPI00221FF31C|nr:tail fiber assembly protein [Providencia rettgeri]UYV41554.1 tail fiber assembly protein [Providencia rettgeri]
MIHYKDKENQVFAYAKSDLLQIDRLSELERLIQEKEPIYITSTEQLQNALLELEQAKQALELASISEGSESDIELLLATVTEKEKAYESTLAAFNTAEFEYLPIKHEYDAILPVFFDIRENIKGMNKMSEKEVNAYLNPPIPKEQVIAEAEQQKQLLLMEANSAIAPLQYAVDLDMATNEEIVNLKAWKKYSVLLNRVDTSLAPDIDWPEKPE